MPQILPDDQILKDINSLNSKQREVFNVVHVWVTDCIKYDRHDVEPVQMFLSGSAETGKCHLINVTYNAISKT